MAAPATILKESLKGTGRPGMGCEGGDIEPSRWGCCRSSGRRQRPPSLEREDILAALDCAAC